MCSWTGVAQVRYNMTGHYVNCMREYDVYQIHPRLYTVIASFQATQVLSPVSTYSHISATRTLHQLEK